MAGRSVALDARLTALREMAGPCALFADIVTDHGRLGADLLLRGQCARAMFTDISEASLAKARRLIAGLGLADRAVFGVGDGAAALLEAPDVAVIAGMGGQTIAQIVEQGMEKLRASRLVLQPNVAAPELRRRLAGTSFRITDERVVRDGRRLYVLIAAQPGEMRLTDCEAEIGPVLLQKHSEELADYRRFRLRVAKKALAGAERGARDTSALRREIEIWEAFAP